MTWKFVKPDCFLIGVPARDLSDEEYETLGEEQKKAVRESGVYRRERAKDKDKAEVKDAD
jgi:hypothetical protein